MPSLFKTLFNRFFAYFEQPPHPQQPTTNRIHRPTTSLASPQTNGPSTGPSAVDLQKEIRDARKFSIAEAIGREGGSFMKGESTIPRPLMAITQINQFLTTHSNDPASALSTTLQAWVSSDICVSRQLDTPLMALSQILDSTLTEPTTFCEFSRQVAIAHSKLTGDRPYFQKHNAPPHPDADYTHAAIKAELSALHQQLKESITIYPSGMKNQ